MSSGRVSGGWKESKGSSIAAESSVNAMAIDLGLSRYEECGEFFIDSMPIQATSINTDVDQHGTVYTSLRCFDLELFEHFVKGELHVLLDDFKLDEFLGGG